VLSLIEDAIVAAMIWLVAKAPVVAGVTAFILAIVCVLIVWRLWKFVKKIFRRRPSAVTAG
jgi:O-antigen/teichoic acid export membrane protein